MVRHGQIWFSENGHIIATFLWKLSEKNSKKPSEHFSAYNLSKNLIFLKIKIDHVSWSDHGQLWWSDPEPDDGQTMVNHGLMVRLSQGVLINSDNFLNAFECVCCQKMM